MAECGTAKGGRKNSVLLTALLALLPLMTITAGADAAAAQTERARVERSVHLRENWKYLTRNVAFPAQWTDDGAAFVYRKTVEGGFAFVRVDDRTLEKSAPFDAARLAEALGKETGEDIDPLRLPFDGFTYADDGKAIELRADDTLYRCTLNAYVCAEKTEEDERPRGFGVVRDLRVPANNEPSPSPDERFEAFVRDDNLALRDLTTGDVVMLSRDGSPGNFYDPETLRWSPDSSHIAIHRVRPGHARYVTRVEAAPDTQVDPVVHKQLYPKPGDAVDIEQPVLFDIRSRRQIDVDNKLFPNPYRLSPPDWRKDSASFAFDYDRRGHGQVRVIAVDADTGGAHAAVTEDSDTFVYADRRFRHDVGDLGEEMIWISERDGWRHLYLIDSRRGRVKRQITKGDWIVRDVVKVDDDSRRIWFSASGRRDGEDPYFVHYYRVNFDGSDLTRLTEANATHTVSFSPDMTRYVDVYSRVDLPNMMEVHDAEDGALIATMETGDISRLETAGFRPPQPFTAKGRDGKTDIWGLVVRPRDYDPARSYPVIENIYAGPHDNFVPKRFWPFGYHSGGDKVIGMQAQADLGFIVVQIDGMGTANRSKVFHDVAWKNLDDSGFPDRIAWMRALAKREPAADLSRVGIYGASAGGQSALNALLFHPEFYTAAVAYAGCYDNRMDKISWNEQWLGWPVDQSYLDASGVVNAHRLQGDLLMIVGEQDSNVDPASTLQVADALIEADKDFELLVVPGGEHSVGRSTGPIDYVQRRQFEFFLRKLSAPGGLAPD